MGVLSLSSVTPPILAFWSRNSSPAACILSPIVSDSVVGRRGLTLPRLHGRQLHSRANCWGMQAGVTNGDRHTASFVGVLLESSTYELQVVTHESLYVLAGSRRSTTR
jgi:hypothetical protein